ncbi:MAG: TIGR00366 family protein [Tissierellia bacterium]|nr:TIGR00366 family protein [Tissierellia bacterium]
MFKKLTNSSVRMVERLLPDAFIFCVILTILAFVLAIITTGQGPMQMILHWGNGVWGLLLFSMQMALVLVLGNAFATSGPIKNFLKNIARRAKTPTQAIVLVSFVSAVACWINWGFGLIVGALLARELAKNVKGVDYRLLIASAYSGFVVWHNGISGSIPLQVASDLDQLTSISGGLITELIPVSKTLFSPWNLIVVWLIILTLPLLNKAMHPNKEDVVEVDPKLLEEAEEVKYIKTKDTTPAEKMENSAILSAFITVIGVVYLVYHFYTKGFDLSLNIVNFIFLILGIAFHKTPINYVRAVDNAVKGAGGVILQFPFYAGIMGMMTGQSATGVSLAGVISQWFVAISTPRTYPLFAFWSAGIVNFFVPSGGGQWAVQGPIMMPASISLGVDPAKTALAIAWGDAWTNMIQPFWALPALGVAGLGARDIMGYCLMVLLYTGVIISLAFLFI